eukprot:9783463-Ditylum_brightwellii.AAC.1
MVFFLGLEQIKCISPDRMVTHAQLSVDYWLQKEDPNGAHIIVGGNLINYPYNVSTCTKALMEQSTLNT